MNQHNDEDRLDEIITQAADLGEVKLDRAEWLGRLAAQSQEPDATGSRSHRSGSGPDRKIWRTIMESRITRYSAAATILVAASLVLFNPFGFSGGRSGVVLAEAAQKMDEVQTIVHKERRAYYEVGKDEPLLRADVVKYVSSEHGIVEQQYDKQGKLQHRVCIQKDSQQMVLMLVEDKKYLTLSIADSWARLMENLTPKGIADHVRAGNCRELGPAKIDGHDVQGFETLNPGLFPIPEQYAFLFPIKEIKWQFWIDQETLLLVAADMEITTGRGLFTGFRRLRITCHGYDMRYDQELPASVFDPNIPDDYTPMNLESVVQENAAWLGVGGLPLIGFVAYRRRSRRRRPERPKRR